MQMHELTANGFAHFNGIDDRRKRSTQVNAVKYIGQLAAMTKTDISSWDITKMFGRDDGSIIQDKTKINKTFFTAIENGAEESPIDLPIADIEKMQGRWSTGRISTLEHQLNTKTSHANSYLNSYTNYMRQAAGIKNQIAQIKGGESWLLDEVKRVIDSGNWTDCELDMENNYITFTTKHDAILKYVDRNNEVDITYNFGKFKAEISLSSFLPLVWPTDWDKVHSFSRGYCHPHIPSMSRHGKQDVCLGSLRDEMNRATSEFKFAKCFEIIHTVLNSYNHGDAYKTLPTFQQWYDEYHERNNDVRDSNTGEDTPEDNVSSEEGSQEQEGSVGVRAAGTQSGQETTVTF